MILLISFSSKIHVRTLLNSAHCANDGPKENDYFFRKKGLKYRNSTPFTQTESTGFCWSSAPEQAGKPYKGMAKPPGVRLALARLCRSFSPNTPNNQLNCQLRRPWVNFVVLHKLWCRAKFYCILKPHFQGLPCFLSRGRWGRRKY